MAEVNVDPWRRGEDLEEEMTGLRRRIALLGALVVSTALVGCAGGVGQTATEDGEGVAVGATKEEYIAAFEDVEPIELTYQDIASAADTPAGKPAVEWLAEVEEWSGGKVTFNIAWANSIASAPEVPDALQDGRLDIANWSTSYFPDEAPANNDLINSMVSVPSSPLVGELTSHLAGQQVAFETPEVMAEFTDRGFFPLNPFNFYGTPNMLCGEDKPDAASFQGDQVRVNNRAHDTQVGALGMTTTSIDALETYEALQRGVADCTFASASAYLGYEWINNAPHVYVPQGGSFAAGPATVMAGSSWDDLPLVVRQLIFDRMVTFNASNFANIFAAQLEGVERAQELGGSFGYMDEESSQVVTDANSEILSLIRESSNLDGEALVENVEAATATWTDRLAELGYKDEGSFEDFPQWYPGSNDASSYDYTLPIAEALQEEVLNPHRPE